MDRAIYPGSFDPITLGHLDIIGRASKMFKEVVVAVLVNPDKKGLFDVNERVELIRRVVKPYKNVRVESFSGLLINYMKQKDIKVIIRGLRAVSDFEYEFQMALTNTKLAPDIETIFMMTNVNYCFFSSSSVKQVAMFGGEITGLVPKEIIPDIQKKFRSK